MNLNYFLVFVAIVSFVLSYLQGKKNLFYFLECVPINSCSCVPQDLLVLVLKFILGVLVCASIAVAIRHSVLKPRWPC